MNLIEISSIDIRFSHTRHKNAAVEKRLIESIRERGILDSLHGAPEGDRCVLLDGFKRYRCARKLAITQLPVEYIGTDVASGLLMLLRRSVTSGVTTMEQSALIEELHKQYGMSIYDIAVHLERSPAWVSVRLGMVEQLSPLIKEKIMSGAFPVRAYLYGLKGFTRVNRISTGDVDACVTALSGRHLSTRDLYTLTRAYFCGGEAIKHLITDGDVHRALQVLRNTAVEDTDLFSPQERQCIEDLKRVSAAVKRLVHADPRNIVMRDDVAMEINQWCAALLRTIGSFHDMIRDLHERTRPSGRGITHASAGTEQAGDCPVAEH